MKIEMDKEKPLLATQTIDHPRQSVFGSFFSVVMENKAAVVGGLIILFYIFIAVFAPVLAPYHPHEINLDNKLIPPSMEHWMGTDDKGRDILSRIFYGSRECRNFACRPRFC